MKNIMLRNLKYREENEKEYEGLNTSKCVLSRIRALEDHIFDNDDNTDYLLDNYVNNDINEDIDKDLSRLSFLREKYILLVRSEM